MLSSEAREARAAYLKKYRAEHPLTEEQKKKKREYYKEWKKRNPEKVEAQQERYWARKAEQILKEVEEIEEIQKYE